MSKRLREELFDLYSKNLSKARPDIEDKLACPICLKMFDHSALDIDQMLTVGHIIPNATGGKISVLECGQCNHHIGSSYDVHAAKEREHLQWMNMDEGTSKLVHINIENAKASAYWVWEKGGVSGIKAASWEDPNYHGLMRKFGERVKLKQEVSLNMDYSSKYTPKKVVISLLHSAFLMMFYRFGYEYVLDTASTIARDLILNEKGPWDPGKMVSTTTGECPYQLPIIGVIRHPRKIRAFVVAMPTPLNNKVARLVFLPGYNEGGMKAFGRLMDLRSPTSSEINVNMDLAHEDSQYRLMMGACHVFWHKRLPLQI